MCLQGEWLSELLRPRRLGDLMLPRRDIERLQQMIDADNVMNMLFYGQFGLGKTSAGRLIARSLGPGGFREFNGSLSTGIDFVRGQIESYANSASLISDHRKICFIDEAELSKPAQNGLRKVIEDSWSTCRFILAVNDVSKIIPALRSRLVSICFDIAPSDRAEVKHKLLHRYCNVLRQREIQFDEQRLIQLIGIYYPDLRSIATHVQYEFAYTTAFT
jgi:DNA polymerase III delta prime subunit